jgi:hypothetical protein
MAAKGDYAKNLGAAANFVSKKVTRPGPTHITGTGLDKGFVASRADPVSLGVSAVPAVIGGLALAPAAAAGGLTTGAATVGRAATGLLGRGANLARMKGAPGTAKAAVGVGTTLTGLGRATQDIKKQVQQVPGLEKASFQDIATGAFKSARSGGASAGDIRKIATSREAGDTIGGVSQEIAAGMAAPAAHLATRSPGAYGAWSKAKKAGSNVLMAPARAAGAFKTPISKSVSGKSVGSLMKDIGAEQRKTAAQSAAFHKGPTGQAISRSAERLGFQKSAAQTPMSTTRAYKSGGSVPNKGGMFGYGRENPTTVARKQSALKSHMQKQADIAQMGTGGIAGVGSTTGRLPSYFSSKAGLKYTAKPTRGQTPGPFKSAAPKKKSGGLFGFLKKKN